MRQAFRFKRYHHKRNRFLERTIDIAAGAWNHALALHRAYYRLFDQTLPKAKLQSHLAPSSGMLLPAMTSNQPSPRDFWSLAWIKPPSDPTVSGGPGIGSVSQSR